jgi:hypothetical protein
MNKIKSVGNTHDQPWQKVTATTNFPMQALVYEVRATDGNGNPVDVEDDGKVDREGTMYIGEQGDGVERFKNLIIGFQSNGTQGNHDAPKKYFNESWDKKYPLANLEAHVTLMVRPSIAGKSFTRADGTIATAAPKHTATDGKVMATKEERRRLKTKKHKIGRVPPLNGRGGGHVKKAALPAVDPSSGDDTGIEMHDDPHGKLAELKRQGKTT